MLERILYSSFFRIKPEQRKIYDCFPFFNELELLECRFGELYDYVDKFVLVEATKTHQSKSKPLYFLENRERFQAVSDKIIHVVVADLPISSDAMKNERYQRNGIFRGLGDCAPWDIVIVSDVDEIPTRGAMDYYRHKQMYGIKKLDQKLSYYFINCVADIPWRLAFISSYGRLKNKDLGKIRNTKFDPKNVLANGGWHFSYLGGIDQIITKLEAFCHADLNTAQYKDRDWLINCLRNGEDLFGRKNLRYELVPVNGSFPQQIVANADYYRQLGWIK